MRNALSVLFVLVTVACATTKPETKSMATQSPVVSSVKPEFVEARDEQGNVIVFEAPKFLPMDVVGPKGTYRCECIEGSTGRLECRNCKCVEEKPAAMHDEQGREYFVADATRRGANGKPIIYGPVLPEVPAQDHLSGSWRSGVGFSRTSTVPDRPRKMALKGPPGEPFSHIRLPEGQQPYMEYHRYEAKKKGRDLVCPLKPRKECNRGDNDEACVLYSECLEVSLDEEGNIIW